MVFQRLWASQPFFVKLLVSRSLEFLVITLLLTSLSLNVLHVHFKHFELSVTQFKESFIFTFQKKIASLALSQRLTFTIFHP